MAYQKKHPSTQVLGGPLIVFNNEIACFNSQAIAVRVGDILVAETNDALHPYRFGPIDSLQVNNVNLRQVLGTAAAPVQFGAKVGFRVTETWQFFVVDSDSL